MKPIPFNLFLETVERMSHLNKEIEQKTTYNLGLTFINPEETERNVCFANSNEVRPEFKETFTSIDLINYFYAIVHSSKYRESIQEYSKIDLSPVLITTDKAKFWRLIALGKKLSQTYLSKNKIIILSETIQIIKEIDAIEI